MIVFSVSLMPSHLLIVETGGSQMEIDSPSSPHIYNIFARDVVYEVLGLKRVDLRRRDNSGTPPSGLYCCDIPTGKTFPIGSAMRKRVYVGLYANGGG